MSNSPPSKVLDLDIAYIAKTVIELDVKVKHLEKDFDQLVSKMETYDDKIEKSIDGAVNLINQNSGRITQLESQKKGSSDAIQWVGWFIAVVVSLASLYFTSRG